MELNHSDANSLVSELIALTNNNKKQNRTTGTVTKVDTDGTVWVRIIGSDSDTPCERTSSVVEPNDIVSVTIENGRGTVEANYTRPSTDDTRAISAEKTAFRARDAAEASAADAEIAKSAAQAAYRDAEQAAQYATDAHMSLSEVERVVGTVTWIAEHGSYVSQAGQVFDPDKIYYTRSGTAPDYVYEIVTDPIAEDIDSYYVLAIDESVQNYIASHLAQTDYGLNLMVDGTQSRLHIGTIDGQHTMGTYIIGPTGNIIAEFRQDGIFVGTQDGWHLDIDRDGFLFGFNETTGMKYSAVLVDVNTTKGGEAQSIYEGGPYTIDVSDWYKVSWPEIGCVVEDGTPLFAEGSETYTNVKATDLANLPVEIIGTKPAWCDYDEATHSFILDADYIDAYVAEHPRAEAPMVGGHMPYVAYSTERISSEIPTIQRELNVVGNIDADSYSINGVPFANYIMPAGRVIAIASNTAPEGYLLCDGSEVSRETYAELFAVIGTTWGAGDGYSTFNLPDLRGRTLIGASSGHALASTGGEETHTLTSAESGVPAHAHGIPIHRSDKEDASLGLAGNTGAKGRVMLHHNQGYDSTVDISTANNTAKNATQAHNNMQPYGTINWFISIGGSIPSIKGDKGETGDVGNVIHIGTTQPASDSSFVLWYNPSTGALKAKQYVTPDAYTDGGWAWREFTFADTGKNGDVYTATADAS